MSLEKVKFNSLMLPLTGQLVRRLGKAKKNIFVNAITKGFCFFVPPISSHISRIGNFPIGLK